MGRGKLTLVGAGCLPTVHSSWNIGAQEKKNQGWGFFCLFVSLFLGFFVIIIFVTSSFFSKLMGQQANPV